MMAVVHSSREMVSSNGSASALWMLTQSLSSEDRTISSTARFVGDAASQLSFVSRSKRDVSRKLVARSPRTRTNEAPYALMTASAVVASIARTFNQSQRLRCATGHVAHG